jgi:hypothetical protein
MSKKDYKRKRDYKLSGPAVRWSLTDDVNFDGKSGETACCGIMVRDGANKISLVAVNRFGGAGTATIDVPANSILLVIDLLKATHLRRMKT